ncbi:MAG: ribosome biogenesis GTPase Der [Alphaproteobacteria bacterium]
MSFKLAIIGRPNVGKSTLFNRLVGRRLALVDDQPGVTRDRREGEGRLLDLTMTVVDTAGLEDATDDRLEARMRRQTEQAIEESDVCLFLIDARAGVTPLDAFFADLLRKSPTPTILVANKSEGKAGEPGFYESYGLGLGDPIALSAEHGEGMGDLHEMLLPFANAREEALEEDNDIDLPVDEFLLAEDGSDVALAGLQYDKPLRIAIVGRPNAGKSTLINKVIGDDRLLTGPEAGITRDSISVEWEWQKNEGSKPFRDHTQMPERRNLKLFDTAGMRKRARVKSKIEKLSVADGLRAVRFAEIVIVMMDATMPFEKQDLHIADLVAREGRGLIMALNKWDLVEDKQATLHEMRLKLGELLPQIKGVPMVTLSALTGKGIERLIPAVLWVEQQWCSRIGTSALNRWLEEAITRHPPPAPSGRRIKIRYMTQVRTRPPTFVAFVSKPDDLSDSYKRYMINSLRERFGIDGVPIRLFFRGGKNPYAPKAK